ncbi:MAG: glycosyltransferase family 4 protein [bacterium]|nr:glycosyltransferase family 4 protein [bacterium]
MKIAFCCLEWEPIAGGGIRTYVENVTRTLGELGHESHVITYDHKGAKNDRATAGVQVHRVKLTGLQRLIYRATVLLGLGDLSFRLFYALQVARRVRALAEAERVDVVETPDYAAEGIALTWLQRRSARWRFAPHVVMLHTPTVVLNEINGKRGPIAWIHEKLENWNIRRATHVSSPSHALARRVTQQLGLEREVAIDPYPNDVTARAEAAATAPAPDRTDELRLLYVGRLEHRKGVTFLVEALNTLCPEHPELTAELVGGDTTTAPGGRSMLAHLRRQLSPTLAGRVRFVPPVPRDELFARYRSAAFCVFPSVFENFANTCLEAIAMGRVVVVPRDSGMAEMIDDGSTGFTFENENTADLIRAIKTCLEHRDQWPAMGRRGQEFLTREFEPHTLVRNKLARYAELRA